MAKKKKAASKKLSKKTAVFRGGSRKKASIRKTPLSPPKVQGPIKL